MLLLLCRGKATNRLCACTLCLHNFASSPAPPRWPCLPHRCAPTVAESCTPYLAQAAPPHRGPGGHLVHDLRDWGEEQAAGDGSRCALPCLPSAASCLERWWRSTHPHPPTPRLPTPPHPTAPSTGRCYSIWKVTDLDQTCLSLFLFSGAHDDLWKEPEGTIIALFTPKASGCTSG